MKNLLPRMFVVFAVLLAAASTVAAAETENIIFVMTDGLRCQEVFGGADAQMFGGDKNGKSPKHLLQAKYCKNTPEESRQALMPFLWTVIAKNGQIYGNEAKHSSVKVANLQWFSYPGYSETLCGFADPRINRNDFGPNPNVTVLEWLHCKPCYQGRVAAFGAWAVINDIFNRGRCGFPVNAGFVPFLDLRSEEIGTINRLKAETPRTWAEEPFDTFAFNTALAYFKAKHPRVLYVSLGETDEWAHANRYDEYLNAANRADRYVKTLWELAQSLPEYRGKTTLLFSADHGRGATRTQWTDHGIKTPGSGNIWFAALGPDTPELGERADAPTIGMNQIAATLAALLGEDYCKDVPKAGKPIADILRHN